MMKKSLAVVAASMLLALPLAFQVESKPVALQAYEPVGAVTCGVGLEKLTVHFHAWEKDYSEIGAWTWDTGAGGTQAPVSVSSVDDFGGVFEFCVNPSMPNDSIGFIPFYQFNGVTARDTWWDSKLTKGGGDIKIDVSTLKGDATSMEVYILEGAGGGDTEALQQRGVYEIDPLKRNVLIAYFDPANAYEENLGIHPWGAYDAPLVDAAWGTPVKVFEDGAAAPSSTVIKTYMATAPANSATLGGLIYAGTDDTKKHPTFDPMTKDFGEFATLGAGELGLVLVVNGIVFGDLDDFAEEAFRFEFMGREVADSGLASGTFAVDPNTILVKTNVKVAVSDDTAAIKGRFSVKQGTTEVAITSVDYDVNAASTNAFVLNLGSNLDTSKVYTISYDDGINTTEDELDMDTEAPVITFLSEDVDVEIELGGAWSAEYVPSVFAQDNRDGDITALVYIAPGDGYINTGFVGEYDITFTVYDVWGNKGEATFTVSVVEPEVTGGCAATAEGGSNGIGLLVSLLAAAWLIKKSALGVAK